MIINDEREEYDINFDCPYDGPSNDVFAPKFSMDIMKLLPNI